MSVDDELIWLRQCVGVFDLTDRAILEVTGDDAREWLQGQITNQVEGVEPGDSVYGFVLTLKGRVLADAWVLAREDGFWLDVPKSQIDALIARLDRYIIMEDVDLASRDDLRLVTALGPRAEDLLGDSWPTDRLGTGGRTWVLTADRADDELARLLHEARALGGGAVDTSAWGDAHVVIGRPRFGVDFGEQTYPQETGLTALAVSFNKGCYVGQETVVMLQNRGKAPKVLWRWAIETLPPPSPHTPILHGNSSVGELTSAAADREESVALGYLKRGHQVDEDQPWTIGGALARPLGPVEEALSGPTA